MVVFVGLDLGSADMSVTWFGRRADDGQLVQFEPSKPLLAALDAIAAARAPDHIGLWRAKRLGLADRTGQLTAVGDAVLNHYRGT